MPDIQDSWHQGRDAWEAGKTLEENPYGRYNGEGIGRDATVTERCAAQWYEGYCSVSRKLVSNMLRPPTGRQLAFKTTL